MAPLSRGCRSSPIGLEPRPVRQPHTAYLLGEVLAPLPRACSSIRIAGALSGCGFGGLLPFCIWLLVAHLRMGLVDTCLIVMGGC